MMTFDTDGQAEPRARALAAKASRRLDNAEVWIHDAAGRLVGRWVDDRYEIVAPGGEAVAA